MSRRSFALAVAALAALLLGAFVWGAPSAALATEGAVRAGGEGAVVARLPVGVLELAPGEGGFVAEIEIANETPRAVVTQLRVLAAEDDAAARAVHARFLGGGEPSARRELAPGAVARARVAWMPAPDAPAREVWTHVAVQAEGRERAFGVHGVARRGPRLFAAHALALTLAVPALGALLAAALHRAGRATLDRVGIAATGAALALTIGAVAVFDPAAGPQLVERVPWLPDLGVELRVGLDGVAVPALLAISVVGFSAALAGAPRAPGALAAALGLQAALAVAVVALDALVLVAALEFAVLAASALVASTEAPGARGAAVRLGAAGLVGAACALVAFLALHAASSPALLANGASVPHSFALEELARVRPVAGATLLGVPFGQATAGLAALGFAALLGAPPAHGWLVEVVEAVPAPVAALVAGGVPAAALVGLLRVLAIAPDVAAPLAPWLVGAGVLGLAHAALAALAEGSPRRLAALASAAHGGLCLAAAATLTGPALSGCILHGFARTLALAALVLAHGGDARGLRAAARALSSAAPGAAGFWGALLALSGIFAVSRPLAVVAAFALAALAAAHLGFQGGARGDARPVRPTDDAHPAPSPPRLAAALVPLLALSFALGLTPAPLLAAAAGFVHDATASRP